MIMNNKYDIKEDKKAKKPKTTDDMHMSMPDSNSYLADADRPFTGKFCKQFIYFCLVINNHSLPPISLVSIMSNFYRFLSSAEDAKNLSDLEGRIHAMSLEMSALLTERKQLLLVKKDPVMGVGRSAFIGNFFDLNKGCNLIRSNGVLPIEHDLTARVIEELFRASFDLEKVPKNNKERASKKRGADDDDTDDE